MAFIIAHPYTLIMYETMAEAATAAKLLMKKREDGKCPPLPIAIYSVEKAITIEPPPVIAPIPPKRYA